LFFFLKGGVCKVVAAIVFIIYFSVKVDNFNVYFFL